VTRDVKARIALAVVLVVTLASGVLIVGPWSVVHRRIDVVGYFANSNGIFVGDDVRILGVPVGKIDRIEAQPDGVKINFWLDKKYKVPANVDAVIISPAVVSARAIQLTPAYTGGSELRPNSVIPRDRTAVPVEWDNFREQLKRLTDTLQPTTPGGVSTMGALVNTAADNLRGQGANIRDAVVKLSQLFSALGDHSGDIFSTVKNLALLVTALQGSTDAMRQLNVNFAAVSALLVNDPNEVSTALNDFNTAVGDVKTFITENRDSLGTTIDKLSSVSQALADSIPDLKQTLHIMPNTLQNISNMYSPARSGVVGALAMPYFSNPITFICGLIQAASRMNAEQSAKLCVQYLAPIVKNRQYNFLPIGMNQAVGTLARPNEVTFSENWMRPDYIPPATAATPPPADAATPGTPPPSGGPPSPQDVGPLAAEQPIATDPQAGLPGLMVPKETP
jgi:phospholipid/cholesterol/gamma-HCH transport system substrate-binding protein